MAQGSDLSIKKIFTPNNRRNWAISLLPMTSPSGMCWEGRTRTSHPGTKPGSAHSALKFPVPPFPHLCNGDSDSCEDK